MCKAFLPAVSFHREFLNFRFWNIPKQKKKDWKAELCIKQNWFAERFPGSSVTPVSQLGFPAPDETDCLMWRCDTLCSCLWGWTISTLHGVTLYHADFSSQPWALSELFLSTKEVQRCPDVSWCVIFNCQTNLASYLMSPPEGCMLSSAFHIIEKLCNLFFKNIKNKKLSFHKKFSYTFREGLLFLNCIYPTHNITTFKYNAHTKSYWIIISRRR